MPFDIIYHCFNSGVNFLNNRIDRNLKYNTYLRHELNYQILFIFTMAFVNNIGTRGKVVGTYNITWRVIITIY